MMRIKFIEDKVAVLTENYFWNRRNIYEEVFEIIVNNVNLLYIGVIIAFIYVIS